MFKSFHLYMFSNVNQNPARKHWKIGNFIIGIYARELKKNHAINPNDEISWVSAYSQQVYFSTIVSTKPLSALVDFSTNQWLFILAKDFGNFSKPQFTTIKSLVSTKLTNKTLIFESNYKHRPYSKMAADLILFYMHINYPY